MRAAELKYPLLSSTETQIPHLRLFSKLPQFLTPTGLGATGARDPYGDGISPCSIRMVEKNGSARCRLWSQSCCSHITEQPLLILHDLGSLLIRQECHHTTSPALAPASLKSCWDPACCDLTPSAPADSGWTDYRQGGGPWVITYRAVAKGSREAQPPGTCK